jgi:Domain of unknown function (DUF6285)
MIQHSPSADALLAAVEAFLKNTAIPALKDHAAYQARVAANAIALVRRDHEWRGEAEARASEATAALLALADGLPVHDEPHIALCYAITSGRLQASDPQVRALLRSITTDQLAIDQPNYRAGHP